MQFHSFSLTDTSPKKEQNEDYYFVDDNQGLYLLSDGLGQYKGAHIASQTLIKTVRENLEGDLGTNPGEIKSQIKKAIAAGAKKLHEKGKDNKQHKSMSTTLTALYLKDGTYHIGHVGDSRCYYYRNDKLTQITNDHTLAYEQYLEGAIEKEEIQEHPNQKLHTRTISARKKFTIPDFFAGKYRQDDIFLLCSDGLNKELNDGEIEEFFQSEADLSQIPQKLLKEVRHRKGSDDFTIVLIQFLQ